MLFVLRSRKFQDLELLAHFYLSFDIPFFLEEVEFTFLEHHIAGEYYCDSREGLVVLKRFLGNFQGSPEVLV